MVRIFIEFGRRSRVIERRWRRRQELAARDHFGDVIQVKRFDVEHCEPIVAAIQVPQIAAELVGRDESLVVAARRDRVQVVGVRLDVAKSLLQVGLHTGRLSRFAPRQTIQRGGELRCAALSYAPQFDGLIVATEDEL